MHELFRPHVIVEVVHMYLADIEDGETDLDRSIKFQLRLLKMYRYQLIVKSFRALEVGFGNLFNGTLFGGE